MAFTREVHQLWLSALDVPNSSGPYVRTTDQRLSALSLFAVGTVTNIVVRPFRTEIFEKITSPKKKIFFSENRIGV